MAIGPFMPLGSTQDGLRPFDKLWVSTNGMSGRSPVGSNAIRPERRGFRSSRRDPRVPIAVFWIKEELPLPYVTPP